MFLKRSAQRSQQWTLNNFLRPRAGQAPRSRWWDGRESRAGSAGFQDLFLPTNKEYTCYCRQICLDQRALKISPSQHQTCERLPLTVMLFGKTTPREGFCEAGASLQGLRKAGTEQVRRKGVSCLVCSCCSISNQPGRECALPLPTAAQWRLQAENRPLSFPPCWPGQACS